MKYMRSAKLAAAAIAACMLAACSGGTPSEVPDTPGGASVITEESVKADSAESSPQTETKDIPEPTQAAPEAEQTAEPAPASKEAGSITETEESIMIDPDQKVIALTFDDGPNATTTNEVLDKLEKYGVTASFFLIGDNINEQSAEAVRRAYEMGCEINNHSKSHPYMNEMTVEEILAEFDYTDQKVFEITGEHTKFFRPPYIAVSQDMLANIDVPFISGIGANDWDDKNPADRRAAMILRQVKDGDIILLHDAQGNSLTVEALDTIIPELLDQGYLFVTVTDLFKAKGIEPEEKIYTNVMQKGVWG